VHSFYQFRLKNCVFGDGSLGALVAAIDKKGRNVVPLVFSMMKELLHRGNDSHGISTSKFVSISKTFNELNLDSVNSTLAIGYNFSHILPRDHPQPIQAGDFSLIFEGRFFPSPNLNELPEAKQLAIKLTSNPEKSAEQILEKIEGSYIFILAKSDRLIVGRDVFGATPLYFAENESLCALASERKALWNIGLKNVKSFPPGNLSIVTVDGFSFRSVKKLLMPPIKRVNLETAAQALQILLLESTRKRVSDLDKVAVAFSGGVDSSVVAYLAKYSGLDVQLITVGLEDQPEVQFAQEAANELDLPLDLKLYTKDDLEKTLEKILWLTEESSSVSSSIAIPFYWTAENTAKLGYPILLAGQGADELFGGYNRYLAEYAQSNKESVRKKMFDDVVNAYDDNFQRDNQVCAFHGVELRLPYIDISVVDFSLRLPFHHKINSINDNLRKQILRRVAQNLDIPDFIANKPKKAVQYTTGVTKALKQIAKNQNLTLAKYIKDMFNKIYQKNSIK
jgi:asparagine synthase (glutamine-hydrolysing)